jgi:tetratricopeptide (TPR) repeat protein
MISKFVKISAIVASLSAAVAAIQNPIGSPTVPPSSTRSGLVRSQNPIDTSGNQLITGNIGGGRYFRGIVPYRATTDFGGTVGTSSLDTFIRDSSGAESYGGYTGKPMPYYSPTQSVTIMTPGGRGEILSPLSTKIDGRAETRFVPPVSLKGQPPPEYNINVPYNNYRPMSTPIPQLEKMFTDEIEKYPQGKNILPSEKTNEQQQKQMEQFRYDLKQVSDKVTDLKQSLIIQNVPFKPPAAEKTGENLQPSQPQTIETRQPDIYEQMKKEVNELQKKFDSIKKTTAARAAKKPITDVNRPAKETATSRPAEPNETDTYLKAKGVLGEHKTFASFSEDRFNQYMRNAENYMKEGKYYKAADLYTLASIHKSDDPLPYAGKSLALFAAGEYMSSALFLSRTLELFPGYAQFKVDLVSMAGNKDMLESRIAEIEQWLQKSEAPELQFLLGYIYYQINRLEPAKKNIDAAFEKMPQAPAVIILKKVIDETK